MALNISLTAAKYLARSFFLNFLSLLLLLLGIVYVFDMVELLRRAAKFDDIPLGLVFVMSLYKLPEVQQIILPFAVMLSAMFTFWQLNRRYELIVLRASGMSVWQFLLPILGAGFLIGVVDTTVINPIGAKLLHQFEELESVHLERRKSIVSFSEQGLWLRQPHDNGHLILHAGDIDLPGWKLKDVMVLFFGEEDSFQRRIDAPSATLEQGAWNFQEPVSNRLQALPERNDFMKLATDLTIEDIEDSFASSETVSFWALPGFIRVMEQTGFDATSFKIHFQVLLSKPLMLVAMILLAASVSLNPPRSSYGLVLILSGILIGFLVFFGNTFLQAMGGSQKIPVFLAAWVMPILTFLAGLTIMANNEDG